jgi:hypothetical protein
MPMEMPGMLKAARVILFIIGGLEVLAALILIILGAAASSDDDLSQMGSGVVLTLGVLFLVVAGLVILMGVRLSRGRGGVRVGCIIYACLMLLGGLSNLTRGAGGLPGAVIGLALGGFLLAAMVNSDSGAWFNRPRP